MLKLLMAEFKYNIWFIVGMYGVFSLLNVNIQLESGKDINFIFWILPFILVNIIIARHDREKRNRNNLLLPVKAYQIGIMRILIVIIPILFYYVMAIILEVVFSPETLNDHFMSYVLACNLLILAYSMYFIVYDYLGNINKSDSFKTIMRIIVINAGLLSIIGLIIYTYFVKSPWLTTLVHFSILVAIFSVFTFTRRKIYLE